MNPWSALSRAGGERTYVPRALVRQPLVRVGSRSRDSGMRESRTGDGHGCDQSVHELGQ